MSYFIAGAIIVTGAYTADQQRQAGKQTQYDLEHQAKQEKLASQDEELQRRRQLNRILSANIVAAGEVPVLGEGSPQSIALKDSKTVSSSEGAESVSARIREDLLKRQGRRARSTGNAQATSTMLQTFTQAGYVGKSGK